MHFGFTIDSSDIYLWDINLLDTDLDLLDTDIPSKRLWRCLACLQDIFKTFWKYVFKMSSRHVLKTLKDIFNVTIFRLQRRLQDVFKTSSRSLQDIFKTSWKTRNCYADVNMLKTSSRHVLKTNKCLLGT